MVEPGDPFEMEQKLQAVSEKLRTLQQDLLDWLEAYDDSYPAAAAIIRIYEEHFGPWESDWDAALWLALKEERREAVNAERMLSNPEHLDP